MEQGEKGRDGFEHATYIDISSFGYIRTYIRSRYVHRYFSQLSQGLQLCITRSSVMFILYHHEESCHEPPSICNYMMLIHNYNKASIAKSTFFQPRFQYCCNCVCKYHIEHTYLNAAYPTVCPSTL